VVCLFHYYREKEWADFRQLFSIIILGGPIYYMKKKNLLSGTLSYEPLDHSKNRLDPVSMGMNKKGDEIANHILPSQFQDLILPNLQEVSFKADTIKTPDFEASGVEVNYKFQDPNPQVIRYQQAKKERTILDRLRLFLLKQSITAFFQFIIMYFPRFIP